MPDTIIRGGTVVDGTGAPRYQADVAIAGGSIARVGDRPERQAVTVRLLRISVTPNSARPK